MKPQRAFVAERPLARHCAGLLAPRRPQADPLALLARIAERAAPVLARGLARLAGGEMPNVTPGAPRSTTFAELSATIAPLAANSLFSLGGSDIRALVSVEAEAVFRLLDRAFGGRGEAPAELPETFPLSAELFLARIEETLAAALDAASGASQTARLLRRDGSLDRLAAFGAGEALAAILFDICGENGAMWTITLALPAAALAALPGLDDRADDTPVPARRKPSIAEAPFADIPLTLRAVLVDMAVPFARLAGLAPGDVIPVSVARTVPIDAGGQTIAHGTVGALDDRVAVQVTKAF